MCWGKKVGAIASAFLLSISGCGGEVAFATELIATGYSESPMGRPYTFTEVVDIQEEIDEEIRLGELELLTQLVHAEAGNQTLEGKRLVADVVLNRVADPAFPDTISEVIFQSRQFSVTMNNALSNAGWHMTDEDFEAVYLEAEMGEQLDYRILYFTAGHYNASGTPAYKVGGHYFSTK